MDGTAPFCAGCRTLDVICMLCEQRSSTNSCFLRSRMGFERKYIRMPSLHVALLANC